MSDFKVGDKVAYFSHQEILDDIEKLGWTSRINNGMFVVSTGTNTMHLSITKLENSVKDGVIESMSEGGCWGVKWGDRKVDEVHIYWRGDTWPSCWLKKVSDTIIEDIEE